MQIPLITVVKMVMKKIDRRFCLKKSVNKYFRCFLNVLKFIKYSLKEKIQYKFLFEIEIIKFCQNL